jgi:hypothetical protein
MFKRTWGIVLLLLPAIAQAQPAYRSLTAMAAERQVKAWGYPDVGHYIAAQRETQQLRTGIAPRPGLPYNPYEAPTTASGAALLPATSAAFPVAAGRFMGNTVMDGQDPYRLTIGWSGTYMGPWLDSGGYFVEMNTYENGAGITFIPPKYGGSIGYEMYVPGFIWNDQPCIQPSFSTCMPHSINIGQDPITWRTVKGYYSAMAGLTYGNWNLGIVGADPHGPFITKTFGGLSAPYTFDNQVSTVAVNPVPADYNPTFGTKVIISTPHGLASCSLASEASQVVMQYNAGTPDWAGGQDFRQGAIVYKAYTNSPSPARYWMMSCAPNTFLPGDDGSMIYIISYDAHNNPCYGPLAYFLGGNVYDLVNSASGANVASAINPNMTFPYYQSYGRFLRTTGSCVANY